jgi:serine protease Do
MTKRILWAFVLLIWTGLSAIAQVSGWIGIRIEDQPERGAIIRRVEPNSPAQKAGLREGDVIIEFNKEAVVGAQQLTRLVRETPADRTVEVKILRAGREEVVNVTTERSGANFQFRVPDVNIDFNRIVRDMPRVEVRTVHIQNGIRVEQMTDQLRDFFGVFSNGGVLVTSVAAGSAAERAGLKAGDVITSVDGKNIRTPADFTREIGATSNPVLKIMRDKQEREIRMQ